MVVALFCACYSLPSDWLTAATGWPVPLQSGLRQVRDFVHNQALYALIPLCIFVAAVQVMLPKDVENAEGLPVRPIYQLGILFASMLALLVSLNVPEILPRYGIWGRLYNNRELFVLMATALFCWCLWRWFRVKFTALIAVAIPVLFVSFMLPHSPQLPIILALLGFALILVTREDNPQMGQWFDAAWSLVCNTLPLLVLVIFVFAVLGAVVADL